MAAIGSKQIDIEKGRFSLKSIHLLDGTIWSLICNIRARGNRNCTSNTWMAKRCHLIKPR